MLNIVDGVEGVEDDDSGCGLVVCGVALNVQAGSQTLVNVRYTCVARTPNRPHYGPQAL